VFELLDDFLIKYVSAGEFHVTPNPRVLSQQLTEADFQRSVKLADPPFLALCQRFIIDVRIADKNVIQRFDAWLSHLSSVVYEWPEEEL
jgi:hypothetical protein